MDWRNETVSLSTTAGPVLVEAEVCGPLAVHRMHLDVGYCITLATVGLRMSWRWRVFVTAEHAKAVAQEMLETGIDWRSFFWDSMPADVRQSFCDIHRLAEGRGAFMNDLIAPAGTLPPGTTILVAGG